ncbi:hypothetical protein RUM43_006873 [Polyplax serrata]|uniref:Uncharacterized protein n=1 Tax=Polyplax serrata TaxID=468196 RepID=A0AAN8PBT7_POLSC
MKVVGGEDSDAKRHNSFPHERVAHLSECVEIEVIQLVVFQSKKSKKCADEAGGRAFGFVTWVGFFSKKDETVPKT